MNGRAVRLHLYTCSQAASIYVQSGCIYIRAGQAASIYVHPAAWRLFIWVFRTAMSPFSIPIGYDEFYLALNFAAEDDSFSTKVMAPFKPFTGGLWAAIFCCIFISGLIIAVTDLDNKEDFPEDPIWRRAITGVYFSLSGYTTGGPVHTAITGPARLANISFSYFVLIVLATYTGKSILLALS